MFSWIKKLIDKRKVNLAERLVENLKEKPILESNEIVVENVSGIDLVIEDLGIPVPRSEIIRLTYYYDKKTICNSYDLKNLINQGQIIILNGNMGM